MTAPFVSLAFYVCEELDIADEHSQKLIMRFCKAYQPDKIGRIVRRAKAYGWWQKNPIAAFLRAVKETNLKDKTNKEKEL